MSRPKVESELNIKPSLTFMREFVHTHTHTYMWTYYSQYTHISHNMYFIRDVHWLRPLMLIIVKFVSNYIFYLLWMWIVFMSWPCTSDSVKKMTEFTYQCIIAIHHYATHDPYWNNFDRSSVYFLRSSMNLQNKNIF